MRLVLTIQPANRRLGAAINPMLTGGSQRPLKCLGRLSEHRHRRRTVCRRQILPGSSDVSGRRRLPAEAHWHHAHMRVLRQHRLSGRVISYPGFQFDTFPLSGSGSLDPCGCYSPHRGRTDSAGCPVQSPLKVLLQLLYPRPNR